MYVLALTDNLTINSTFNTGSISLKNLLLSLHKYMHAYMEALDYLPSFFKLSLKSFTVLIMNFNRWTFVFGNL